MKIKEYYIKKNRFCQETTERLMSASKNVKVKNY